MPIFTASRRSQKRFLKNETSTTIMMATIAASRKARQLTACPPQTTLSDAMLERMASFFRGPLKPPVREIMERLGMSALGQTRTFGQSSLLAIPDSVPCQAYQRASSGSGPKRLKQSVPRSQCHTSKMMAPTSGIHADEDPPTGSVDIVKPANVDGERRKQQHQHDPNDEWTSQDTRHRRQEHEQVEIPKFRPGCSTIEIGVVAKARSDGFSEAHLNPPASNQRWCFLLGCYF